MTEKLEYQCRVPGDSDYAPEPAALYVPDGDGVAAVYINEGFFKSEFEMDRFGQMLCIAWNGYLDAQAKLPLALRDIDSFLTESDRETLIRMAEQGKTLKLPPGVPKVVEEELTDR